MRVRAHLLAVALAAAVTTASAGAVAWVVTNQWTLAVIAASALFLTGRWIIGRQMQSTGKAHGGHKQAAR